VIDSTATPDKNRLSTGTLTFSDIENKAEYKAESHGVGYAVGKDVENNAKGFTPDMGVPVSDDKTSTTHAAIAQGTIEIKDQANQKADITKLSRDTQNAVNKLDQIFDKKSVQEKQELSKMLGQEAFKAVGDLAAAQYKKAAEDEANTTDPDVKAEAKARMRAWDEGGIYKVALHSAVGAVMADLGGGNALSGGVGAGVNEIVQGELAKRFKDNPDLHQWASLAIGSAAAKIAGGDAQTGGATAASGTKNNWLNHEQQDAFVKALKNAESDSDKQQIIAYFTALSQYNIEKYGVKEEVIEWELKDQLKGILINESKGLNYNLSLISSYYFQDKLVKDYKEGLETPDWAKWLNTTAKDGQDLLDALTMTPTPIGLGVRGFKAAQIADKAVDAAKVA
ncbi:adhesin HecA family protein, partial [Acetonema longum DSM 6540]